MLTTIAWKIGEQITYALEGSVFVGGAAIQWLRDGLEIVRSAHETEELALSVADSDGVYFVPALTGLGAPYWDQYARGLLVGLTRGTTRAHIVRAALEGIAFEVYDVIRAMEHDATRRSTEMKVDGGAVANNFLMQFQSDLTRGGVVPAEDSGNDGDGSGLSGRAGRRLLEGYGGDRPLRRGRATLRARNAAVRGRAQDRALA